MHLNHITCFKKNSNQKQDKIPKSLKKHLDIYQYKDTHYIELFILKFIIVMWCYIVIVYYIYKYTGNIYFLLGQHYIGSNILSIILSTMALFALNHWSINNLDDYNKAILGNRLLYLFASHHFFDETDLIFPTVPFLIFPIVRKFLSNRWYNMGIITWQISLIFIIIIITLIFFSKLRLKSHVNRYVLSGNNYIKNRTMSLLFKIFKSYVKRNNLYLYDRWKSITESNETQFNKSDNIILLNAYHAFYVILHYRNEHNTNKKRFNRICYLYKSILSYTYKFDIKNGNINLKLFMRYFDILKAFYKSNNSLLNNFDFIFHFTFPNYYIENIIIPRCLYVNNHLNDTSWSLYDVIISYELENGFFKLYLQNSSKLSNQRNRLCKDALLGLLEIEYKYLVSNHDKDLLTPIKDIINKMKYLHIISKKFQLSTLKKLSNNKD